MRSGRFIIALSCTLLASAAYADTAGLHSVGGLPLYIDGTQSKSQPAPLSPVLIDQVRGVTTLGDALRILGPAYTSPTDMMHIAHWHFQNGAMLTLWPQGGETLTDPVSVSSRPDCGVPAAQCQDLVLYRKKAAQKPHAVSSGSSGMSMQTLSPFMKMIPGR